MPAKSRHFVVSLGDIEADSSTAEVDLSSANWAFVYATTLTGNSNIVVEASPEPFGTTPTWYEYGGEVQFTTAESFCMAIPFEGYWDYVCPQRIRLTLKDSSTATDLTDIYVEGIREIG